MNNYKMLQEIYKSRGEIYQGASPKSKKSDSVQDALKNIEDSNKFKKG